MAPMVKQRSTTIPRTIVIKLGTSSIVHETTHQPLLTILSGIVETVLRLRNEGHKVVLVSSGAIGVGLKRMDMASRPKSLSGKQALAAIGQGRLIALWDNLFGQVGQPIAQILLTRGDISDRTRYLNAVNTLSELLSMGVVPIVNENDTVSVSEIKFGDNDTLSAITASMLHADYLFLMTDVDCLYTSNPRKDPSARPIEVVSSVQAIRAQVSTATLGSSLGTGGMETKLIAADIATAAGVTTIICSSKHPENIFSIIQYNTALRAFNNVSPFSMTPREPQSGRTSPGPTPLPPPPSAPTNGSSSSNGSNGDSSDELIVDIETPECRTPTSNLRMLRPPHTMFLPSPLPLRDLKSWTSHTLSPSGSVVIDAGAHHVLSRRESGGRLLPAGVIGVQGTFASGQAVRIMIRLRTDGTMAAADQIALARTPLIDDSPTTQPATPTLLPAASLTSSISSLDPLSNSLSSLAASDTATQLASTTAIDVDALVVEKDNDDSQELLGEGWELREVGRGLANYNSAQIRRVKGMKSSAIAQFLGYADSEYVAENITIRVPP